MTFSLDAQQDSLRLALCARQAFARGRELRGTDAEEAQEELLNAFDHAHQAGVLCGLHDLPAPFALSQVPALMLAFEDGACDGAAEREVALESPVPLAEAA